MQPQNVPSQQGAGRPWSPEALEDSQSAPGPSGVPLWAPEATFTPIAVGLCQGELGEQDVPDFIKGWIDQALRKGIAEGMHLQCQAPVPMYTYISDLESHRFLPSMVDYQNPDSPTPSELSF